MFANITNENFTNLKLSLKGLVSEWWPHILLWVKRHNFLSTEYCLPIFLGLINCKHMI